MVDLQSALDLLNKAINFGLDNLLLFLGVWLAYQVMKTIRKACERKPYPRPSEGE